MMQKTREELIDMLYSIYLSSCCRRMCICNAVTKAHDNINRRMICNVRSQL